MQEDVMPKTKPTDYDFEETQLLPRVSSLVDRRKALRRGGDRRRQQQEVEADQRVGERRSMRRRRQDRGSRGFDPDPDLA
jgi:hypothetical protein